MDIEVGILHHIVIQNVKVQSIELLFANIHWRLFNNTYILGL
jgi:hypothetical protein